MFKGARLTSILAAASYAPQKPATTDGRHLWTSFGACVVLKQQHRFDMSDPDGRQLFRVVHQLTFSTHPDTNEPLTSDDLATLADAINARAVQPSDVPAFLHTKPNICLLRHAIEPVLARHLVKHHAAVDGHRIIAWRSSDSVTAKHGGPGRQLSSALMAAIPHVPTKPEDIPAMHYFYHGMPYRFISNEYPLLGWVNNGTCTADSIVLHPREPADPGTGDMWILRRHPIAVMVRIDGRATGAMFDDSVPSGCVPVFPKANLKAINYSFPVAVKLFRDPADTTMSASVCIKRTGFPLSPGVTFTDFYAQGQSFKGAPHLLHLNVPAGQGWRRANLLVPISRPAAWSHVKLAHPLWPTGDRAARDAVIKRLTTALESDPDYDAEMTRLNALHCLTRDTYYEDLMPAAAAGVANGVGNGVGTGI